MALKGHQELELLEDYPSYSDGRTSFCYGFSESKIISYPGIDEELKVYIKTNYPFIKDIQSSRFLGEIQIHRDIKNELEALEELKKDPYLEDLRFSLDDVVLPTGEFWEAVSN